MTDGFSDEEVARYWDANAAVWAEQVRGGGDVAREWPNNPAFRLFLGDLRGREVLDAGCGEGYNADASFDAVVSFMALMVMSSVTQLEMYFTDSGASLP